MDRSIPSPCETIIDCSTRIIWLQFCVHDVWHKQIKDQKASRKIPLRYVGHVDPNLEDVMREGKQFGAKCYGQNQLSWSENRCTKWKNNTVDHGVQKVWIPPSINPASMAIPPFLNCFANPPLLARLFQYCPIETLGKHKNKLMGQSYFFNFKKLKNNARCFFLWKQHQADI